MAKHGRRNFEPISASQGESRVGDLTVGDYANGVPNIRLGEMFKSILRQMIWLIPLAAIGVVVMFYLTRDLKRVYTGDARVMVQLGEEHVYNPIAGAASGGGLMTTIDTITLTEAGLMKNNKIIEQVIGELTPNRQAQDLFDKDGFAKMRNASSEQERQDAVMEIRKTVDSSYVVMPRPKSSMIDVLYKHENPEIAVQATNAFIDAYLSFRRQVFVEGSTELITERREATEEQLNSNERAIARFLKKNNVADFDSEQGGLRQRTENLKSSLNETRASVAETEAALAEVENRLRVTPETIDLYRDDRAAQRVSQAELELRQLMAKYLPTSDPVRQKQTELNELRSLQQSYGGKATGGRRVGPNPTHQGLTTQRNSLAATADSMREREFTQQRQLNLADAKIRKLTSLTPEYQNLLRERETLNARLTSYNAKEQEALIDSAQAEADAENVTIISRAQYANKGSNTRLVMLALGSIGWLITIGFFALIRVFLDPRLYENPNEVRRPREDSYMDDLEPELPTPSRRTIPELVPSYKPDSPAYENPYEQQPATYAQPTETYQPQEVAYPSFQPQVYAQAGMAAASGARYAPATGYDPSAYVQYDQSGGVNAVQHASPFGATADHAPVKTQLEYETSTTSTYAEPAVHNTSSNPYLSGSAQAGMLNDNLQFDEYGSPLPPPAT